MNVVLKISETQQGGASGVRVSVTLVYLITTVLLNAISLGMVRIGKATTSLGVWVHRISLHIRSLSHMMAARLCSTFPTACRHTILQMPEVTRLDAAPISIVSNPAASDPTVRNGLSCIGCHTEGMKKFEDGVLTVIEQTPNPPFDKAQALRLYAEKSVMDALVDEDTQRYRQSTRSSRAVYLGASSRFSDSMKRFKVR